MTDPTTPAGLLDAWVDPLTSDDFRRRHLRRRSLHQPPDAARRATFETLCSWNVADLLAERRGDVLAWFGATDGRHLTAEVTPEVAERLHAAGTTLYLAEVEALDGVTTAVADALRVPSANVKSSLFCNRPGATTRMHFDPIDTLTVQITGSKRWWIAPNTHAPDPTVAWATLDPGGPSELWQYAHDDMPATMPDDAEEYLLAPGAFLYVPRGWWHATESDEDSISLHVHHIPVPWVDAVLLTLRARLVRDPAWRAGALGLWDGDRRADTAAAARALLDALTIAVDELDPSDLLPIPAAEATTAPGVVRRAGAGLMIRAAAPDRHVATVVVGEHGVERHTTLELADSHAAACRHLARRCTPTRVDDLVAAVPGLDDAAAEVLVRQLLDAGFLRSLEPRVDVRATPAR